MTDSVGLRLGIFWSRGTGPHRRADQTRNQLRTATVSRRNPLSVKHPCQKLLAEVALVEKELELMY